MSYIIIRSYSDSLKPDFNDVDDNQKEHEILYQLSLTDLENLDKEFKLVQEQEDAVCLEMEFEKGQLKSKMIELENLEKGARFNIC